VPEGFSAGSLDFASSPIAFLIYACMKYVFTWIGAAILTVLTAGLLIWNKKTHPLTPPVKEGE
jgi:PTS system galactitol-specific IIC component